MSKSLFSVLFLFIIHMLGGQEPATIKFARERNQLYFFQTSSKRDTIRKGSGDLFYMQIPDTLKAELKINIENARLEAASGDSLYRLIYLPGMKYEVVFEDSVRMDRTSKGLKLYQLKVRVNGASLLPAPRVLFEFIDRRKNKVLLENGFYYSVRD